MTQPNPPDLRTSAIFNVLSAPRLAPYLAAAEGNHREALRLYHWNIEISGALHEGLHVFEVALRNTMDRQLCLWNATQINPQGGRRHRHDWLMDPSRLLKRIVGTKNLADATRRATRALHGKRTPGHPDLLAHTSFGTWRFLLPSKKDHGTQLLWANALHKAFPEWDGPPEPLVQHVDRIHRTRNRVAHLEPLLNSQANRDTYKSIRAVLGAIDPIVEGWFVSTQRITGTLRHRFAQTE